MAWRKRICDQRMQSHVRPPNIEMSETKYLKTVRAEVAQAQSAKDKEGRGSVTAREDRRDRANQNAQARPQKRVQRASE